MIVALSDTDKKVSRYQTFMSRSLLPLAINDDELNGLNFKDLIDSENEVCDLDLIDSIQLSLIKKKMHGAMNDYQSNKKISINSLQLMEALSSRINRCPSSEKLNYIISITNELTNNLA
ncbi:MAG TPA: hypothetical protein VLZ75_04080 [Chitinophagales bacterium]|nr:hypothetical protein [Chitinophagales bacterium]